MAIFAVSIALNFSLKLLSRPNGDVHLALPNHINKAFISKPIAIAIPIGGWLLFHIGHPN